MKTTKNDLRDVLLYDLEALKDEFISKDRKAFDYHFKLLKGNLKDLLKTEKLEDTEYIVIGSDNFWYASGIKTLKEAIAGVKDIKRGSNIQSYADPETGFTRDVLPETFYIYKTKLVKEI